MRRLRLFCPSVQEEIVLVRAPCETEGCPFWRAERCTATDDTAAAYAPVLDHYPMPDCPKAKGCRWHVQALAEGLPGCPPRRLGETCEHVGGQWNTFEMAPWEQWVEHEKAV